MIIFYIGILFLSLWKIKFKRHGFFNDFTSKEQSDSIKGIFILFVFVRHILQYIIQSGYSFSSVTEKLFLKIDSQLDQLIVVMFLFYSGFGVMESILHKGFPYIKEMPLKRILPTLLNFDIAVLAFFILNLTLGIEMSPKEVALSFVAWDSLGNSNWYIFDIILCYITTWISFLITAKHKALCIRKSNYFSLFIFIVILIILGLTKKIWWYNTLFSFFAGVLFSQKKEQIIPFLKKNYAVLLFVTTLAFIGLHLIHHNVFGLKFNLESIFFALSVILFTMKVKINNKALQWLGKNLFPLYIYQRLAMILLYEMDNGIFVKNHPVFYMSICFVSMILIAALYKFRQINFQKKRQVKPSNKFI